MRTCNQLPPIQPALASTVAAIILIGSGIAKIAAPASEEWSVLSIPAWLSKPIGATEVAAGLLLAIYCSARAVRFAAGVGFLALALVEALTIQNNLIRCGCFGKIDVHPHWLFAASCSTAAALFASLSSLKNLQVASIGAALVGIVAMALALLFGPGSNEGARVAGYLDAWQGQPLSSILPVAMPEVVVAGPSIIICYRRDCDHCRELLPRIAGRFLSRDTMIVLVELSGAVYDEDPVADAFPDATIITTRGIEAVIPTPTLLNVENNIIVNVTDPTGLQSLLEEAKPSSPR